MLMRYLTIMLFLVIILCGDCLILAEDDKTESAGIFYKSGLGEFKKNNYEEALTKFRKAIAAKPDFPEALFKIGECAEKLKDSKAALKNYRLCLKYLQARETLNPEEKNILPLVRRNLDKLDIKGCQLRAIKGKHIDNLLKFAGECLGKRYPRFALKVYNLALELDPTSKAAADAIKKIEDGAPAVKEPAIKPKDKKEVTVFNGADLSNWAMSSIWLPLWSVEKPCIVFNRAPANTKTPSAEPSVIAINPPYPENYTLTMEIFIESRLPRAAEHTIGFMYGEVKQTTNQGEVLTPQRVHCTFEKLNVWEKIKFTKDGTDYTIELSSGAKRSGVLNSVTSPSIGLYCQGYVVRFKNITLKEAK
jgi:hypothetical protein